MNLRNLNLKSTHYFKVIIGEIVYLFKIEPIVTKIGHEIAKMTVAVKSIKLKIFISKKFNMNLIQMLAKLSKEKKKNSGWI